MNNELKYRFNEEPDERGKPQHLHELEVNGEWKALTGCTTILSILAKPALIPWAAKMTVEFLKDKLEGIKKLDQTNFELLLDEAKKAHTKRKEKAGEWGTKIHEEVERYIGNTIQLSGKAKDTTKYDNIDNFIEWSEKNKVNFLESEKNIWSEKLWIGGIVDFICEIDGQVWIGDIKTSGSGIYPDHFFQCAGYHLMLEDMELYPDIKGYLILNLKENGEFLEKRSVSNEANKKIFLNCLEIYRQTEKLKNNIIL